MTALLFVGLLVGLVVIHEFGHFVAAKRAGIRVEEFSIGFGPRLFGWKRSGTAYNFRILLLGGFVRLYGMEPDQEETPDSYNARPIWARVLTIAAGPLMNFLLAIALLWVVYSGLGVTQLAPGPPAIGRLEQGMPAKLAGLRPGDRLLAVDGRHLNNWNTLLSAIAASKGKPIDFTVRRGAKRFHVTLTPKADPKFHDAFHIGVWPLMVTVRSPLLAGLGQGITQTANASVAMVSAIVGPLAHGRAPQQISGVVGIYGYVQQAEASGAGAVLFLAALLSANLGIINLVPFPPLDGERLLVLLIEWIRGRRVDPQREAMVSSIGFMILLGLAVVLAYHDIVRMHG